MNVLIYKSFIEREFKIKVDDIKFIGGGSCRVFEINSEWIFRFSHAPEVDKSLINEYRLLRELPSPKELNIPDYSYFSRGTRGFSHPFGGYRKIKGKAMEDSILESNELVSIAGELGYFLKWLHNIKLPFFKEAEEKATEMEKRNLADFFKRIENKSFKFLNSKQQSWIKNFYNDYLSNQDNFNYVPVIVHGDFDSSNVLVYDNKITGIIDFEGAWMANPAVDFCVFLAEYGEIFLEKMLEKYGKNDSKLKKSILFYSRNILFCELLYGIEEDKKAHLINGLKRLDLAMKGRKTGSWLKVSTSSTRSVGGYPD